MLNRKLIILLEFIWIYIRDDFISIERDESVNRRRVEQKRANILHIKDTHSHFSIESGRESLIYQNELLIDFKILPFL